MSDIPDPNNPGLAVDAAGNPVVDPTKNVLDLVAAAIARQDDLRAWLEKVVDAKIEGRSALSNERYQSVLREFESIERRRIENKSDTKSALDAALAAAKEAVKEQALASDKAISKSESAVTDQIKAVVATVDDLKARTVVMETQKTTTVENRGESRSNIGMVVGIIGVAFGLLSFIVVAANFMAAAR